MTDHDIEIHPKAWGEEHWIVNKEYCGKKLVLKVGHRCSVHYHKIKDEVFYVTSGLVLMEVGDSVRVLGPGMKQHVKPNERHRFTGLENSEIIEFSSTHAEDDSYRDALSGAVPPEEFEELRRRYVEKAPSVAR
jgi:quercetin dioxygenase-like cupin family protein